MYVVYIILYTFIIRFIYTENQTKTDQTNKYCSHPDCSIKYQHTMCAALNKQSPRLYASGMTTWMRYQILLLHNRYRDNIALGLEAGQPPATNMRKMYWDYELEEMAEIWARQCQKRHDECRNTVKFNVLQNMDARPVIPRVTEAQLLTDAVGAWFSGARVMDPDNVWSFRLSNCSASGGCNSHWYSAAAWASTWRLGCSQALCTAKVHSCSLFRKRRTIRHLHKVINATMRTTAQSRENILRRTKYMTTTPYPQIESFDHSTIKIKESPLHRGILESDNMKKRRDPKIIAFTFCNYGPAGNIEGFPIYEPGAACTNCPLGTECVDRTHRALCSFHNDPDANF